MIPVLALLFSCAACDVTRERYVPVFISRAGVGKMLHTVSPVSQLECGIQTFKKTHNVTANYSPHNQTCTMLEVDQVVDDWMEEPDVEYLCDKCANHDMSGKWKFDCNSNNYMQYMFSK